MSQLDVFRKIKRYMPNMEIGTLNLKKGAILKVNMNRSDEEILKELQSLNVRNENILFRPTSDQEPYYIVADDLDSEGINKYGRNPDGTYRPGRLIIETSPMNYQMLIHLSEPLTNEEKRYYLSLMNSDPSATPQGRFARFPGFTNRKPKHERPDGSFPLARLIWVDWKYTAKKPVLGAHILESKSVTIKPFPFPLGGRVCLDILKSRSDFETGDESRTDWGYVKYLIRCGCTDDDIKMRLINERKNWDNHKGPRRMEYYLTHTLQEARKVKVHRGR